MTKKTLNFLNAMDFNLQLFAEEDPKPEDTETPEKDEHSPEPVVFTPEQQDYINQLVNRTYAKASKKAQEQAQKDADAAKEAERLKNLSEAERTNQKIQTLTDQLNALQAEKQQNEMMATVRSELLARGYTFNDAIVSRLAGEDAESTKECIDSFVKEFEKAVTAAVKKAVPSNTPKAGNVSRRSAEEIMKIENLKERQKAINDNLDLFIS